MADFLWAALQSGQSIFVESFGRRRRTKVPEERTRGPRAMLWGFEIFGERSGADVAPDGGSWAWILPRYFASFAPALA